MPTETVLGFDGHYKSLVGEAHYNDNREMRAERMDALLLVNETDMSPPY